MSNQPPSSNLNNKNHRYNLDEEIDAQELSTRLENKDESLLILDVRETIEFHTYNIGGTNIPVAQLDQALERSNWNKSNEIIVICQAGIRSETACNILQQHGFEHARNLKGGLLALQRLRSKV